MKRSTLGWVVAVVLAFGGAALAWVWIAGGSGEPSTELTTPTIAAASTTSQPSVSTTQGGDVSTTHGEDASATRSYVIDSASSTVSFEIDEELQGSPKHVVGTTDQVAGQVLVDLSDLSGAQLSQIVVNVRTLTTDSERRDRAIRGPIILNSASDEHEFVTFDVTSVDGLAGSVEPGDTIEFGVNGDLLIRGITNQVTFDTTVTVIDEATIEGSATAMILRSDFGIGIPSVPGVANVTDEVLLTISFVASAG